MSQVRYMKTEAADFASYKGVPTAAEIEQFLSDRSFKLVGLTQFARHPTTGSNYDLLFQRKAQ